MRSLNFALGIRQRYLYQPTRIFECPFITQAPVNARESEIALSNGLITLVEAMSFSIKRCAPIDGNDFFLNIKIISFIRRYIISLQRLIVGFCFVFWELKEDDSSAR